MAAAGGGVAGGLPDRRRARGGCGGKGCAEGARRARKTVQWTVFSDERALAPEGFIGRVGEWWGCCRDVGFTHPRAR